MFKAVVKFALVEMEHLVGLSLTLVPDALAEEKAKKQINLDGFN